MLMTFTYGFYPHFSDLRSLIGQRIAELGGADLESSGPPGFHRFRRLMGWRAARHIQLLAESWGLNGAARQARKVQISQ